VYDDTYLPLHLPFVVIEPTLAGLEQVLAVGKLSPLHLASQVHTLGNPDSRQPTHTGIPTVPEERAVPMITGVFALPQMLSSAMLIFFFLRLPLEALLVLVFIFSKKIRRSWPLIPHIPYLFFCDIYFLLFLGPIAGISLFALDLAA
jgi:hypothetical protein